MLAKFFMQIIQLTKYFPQPLSQVFTELSDHARFGEIVGAKISRVKDSDSSDVNGLGSVRRIQILPGLSFEETIIEFIPEQLIRYSVTKGSPIKDHVGELMFREQAGRTRLDYRIQFLPKLPLPGWGMLLKHVIQQPIESGLRRYASESEQP